MNNIFISLFCIFSLSLSVYAQKIEIYHTSDVHGWYMSRPAKWDKENSTRSIGGFAVLSSLVKQSKNPYILVDSGDMFQGTPEGNFTKGEATVRYMNALGYSAAVVGNHDYDYGENNLILLSDAAKFPILGANVYRKKDGKRPDYLKPYVIIEKAGKKIAFLGIAGTHTKTSTLPKNVEHLNFLDEYSESAKYAAEIRKNNPDISALILLPHIGIDGKAAQQKVDYSSKTFDENEIKWSSVKAARAAKADITIGGHNHTGLISGYRDPQGGLICESFWGLTDVTKIEIVFDEKTGKIQSSSCSLLPLWADLYGEDPEILKITSELSERVSKEMDKKLGEAENDILGSKDSPDSPIGNWMTDVMRQYAKTDMAFQNSGGIRSVINKGEIKIRDIYQVMPFENTLVKMTMTGNQIKKLIQDNFRGNKSSMQISGLTVKYKTKDGKNSEIILERNGKEIKPDDKFSVVTNNYLTTGGTGGSAFLLSSDIQDTMIPVRDALMEYIQKEGKISAPASGRFIQID
ncbi:MAG: bifunctional UDP-sugar hydrolase/5'-nucleotidase [Elusimicrobiota bacterium]